MYLIENAESLRPNMWVGRIPPVFLEHLKDGLTPMGPYSVLAARIRVKGRDLTFSPNDAILLCRGVSDDAIFLNNGSSECSEKSQTANLNLQKQADGDEGFIESCRNLVGEEFAILAKILMKKVRRAYPGRLVEGQSRKWLNHPDNFVAITIQNRDRSLAISIRDVPEALDSELHPKRDRPGYLRFKVSKPSQIGEALRLILASAHRS